MSRNFVCGSASCTACGACIDSCPFNALELSFEEYGELAPKVDYEKCQECGVCHKVCPALHPAELHMPTRTYAAWSKKGCDVRLSSSGGVAAVLSRSVIESGGVVFSTAVVDGSARCVEASSIDEIDNLRGSRYVYSAPSDCYKKIKAYLRKGVQVLFVSTPCQIAALRSILGSKDWNLICVDLICHGTPSPALLEEHFRDRGVAAWDSFSFRGERDFKLCAYSNQEIVYEKPCFEDEYFSAFVTGIIHRNACYECPYACNKRTGDLTIGDFWGLDKESLKVIPPGKVSLVLANTPVGLEVIDGLREDLYLERRSFMEADNESQTNLHAPSTWTKDRNRFMKKYRRHGFDASVHATLAWKRFRLRKLKHRLLEILS